jgi:hypothetical protein
VLIFLIALLGLLVLYVLAVSHVKRSSTKTRAGVDHVAASSGRPSELLELDALIFELPYGAGNERPGICLRILDERGNDVGYVADDRPHSRLAFLIPPKIAVYDRNDTKVIEFVTPASSRKLADIADGAGRPVGSIVPEDQEGRRFILRDTSRGNAARIQWEPGKGRDVRWNAVVRDSWSAEIGRITLPKNIGATDRLLGRERAVAPTSSRWRRRLNDYMTAADAFVLLMRKNCGRDLRLLMLGAAVYLEPATDSGDGA